MTRVQQVRRQDILSAAVTVFARAGYAAASVAAIAAGAAASKGTVRYHFGPRAAIEEAVVADLFSAGASYMGDRIMAATETTDRLRAYVHSNLEFIVVRPQHVNAVNAIMRNYTQQAPGDGGVSWLAEFLTAGQRAGDFDPGIDPKLTALMIRGLVDGASTHPVDLERPDADRYIDECVAFCERAVLAEERARP